MEVPFYIGLVFGLTTLLAIFIFYRAAGSHNLTSVVLLSWIALQAVVAWTGFYTITNTMPPRFMLLAFPALVTIVVLFCTKKGRRYIDSFDIRTLTLLHVVRIPVEIVLYWLFVHNALPGLMTFEGRNADILSGLSAPFIFYYGFVKRTMARRWIILWNFICLALLLNIVINAILSVPSPFQQFGFDRPNVAVLYFPFVWLPCCVVPLVLFSHLVSIRQLLRPLKR